ncbi:MAG: glycosyltransferase family 2 protein [Hyphomicrobium sp.]|nr:glycosyltransferase family 2 protein [Hyphomicrobium sp.]
MSHELRIAIAAIFKNEGPYILEWIAYHRALGIDRFFIADNASNDGSSQLLGVLHDANIINRIFFPGTPGIAPQLPAYREIMRVHGTDADWTAFIDADEFLLPTDGETSVRPFICEVDKSNSVGAIGVNWAIYGSSGHADASAELVTERFSQRAEENFGTNAHYKTIVRNSAWRATSSNPHKFLLESGYLETNTLGAVMERHPTRGDGLSASITWDRLRINHYVVKSKNEFFYRKRMRGRATINGVKRAESFFESHDLNEVTDPMPSWLMEATKAELKRLMQTISSNKKAQIALRRISEIELKPESDVRPKYRSIKGAIDKIEIDADRQIVSVRGWALTANGERVAYLAPMLDSLLLYKMPFERKERPDVVRHIPSSAPDAGYQFQFSLADLPVEFLDSDELRIVGGSAEDSIEFQIGNNGKAWPKAEAQKAMARVLGNSLNPNPSIKDSPEMPPASVEYLAAAMQQCSCYLEYGTGGSTAMAARTGIPAVIAVESDFAWRNAVRRKVESISGHSGAKNLILHSDIGPTKELGYPKSDSNWMRYHNYPLEAWQLCRKEDLSPDLVLIDGRFRVACCLASFLFAAPGTRILFDDYVDRPHYFSVENFVKRTQTIDRVAEFIVPAELPRDEIWLALMTAVTDPR